MRSDHVVTRLNAMSFYVTGGTLQSDAPCYVEREADRQIYEGLLAGEFCHVLTARQMGKSSLMVRAASRLRAGGIRVAALDLTALGGHSITPEQWYFGLLDTLGQELGLAEELETFWQNNETLGPLHRFMKFIRQVLLPRLQKSADKIKIMPQPAGPPPSDQEGAHHPAAGHLPATAPPDAAQRGTEGPPRGLLNRQGQAERRHGGDALISSKVRLVIFVDEIDFVRSLPFSTDEFFAAIRECYNHRTLDPTYELVTFCLLGVASPSDLIRDTRTTPFNIGRRIELNDFTSEEASPLVQGLDEATRDYRNSKPLLDRILYWTEGHPYLTQRLCRTTAEALRGTGTKTTSPGESPSALVDRLCADLFFSARARERDDNLIFVRERLVRSEADLASLLDLYLKVWKRKQVTDDELDPLISLLRLSGVVRVSHGRLRERNPIYYRVFDREWARSNMPEAELRRQRAAFRQGVIRTTGIAAVVVAAMTLMVLIAVKEARTARRALAQSYFSEAEARCVSAASGQRFESLEAIKRAVPVYTNEAKLRDLAISTLALMDLRESRKWAGYPPRTRSVALNTGFNLYARGDFQGNVSIRSTTNDQETLRLPGSGIPAELLRFSPNNQYLAAKYKGDSTNEFVVWDWQVRRAILRLPHEISGRAVDFSADSQRVAFGQPDGKIRVYSLETGTMTRELRLELPTHLPRPPNCIRFHPSANLLAESCDLSGLVQIWNLDSATLQIKNYHRAPVLDLAWHPDGELLAAACQSGENYLWDRHEPRFPFKVLRGHEREAVLIAFNHQGDLLASYSADQSIRLWVPSTGRGMTHPLGIGQVDSLLFSADDRCLGFNRTASEIRIWEVNPAREYRVLLGHVGTPYELESVDFSPDGQFLAAASNDGIILWDAARGKRLEALLDMSIRSALFDPVSGDLMASDAISGFLRWSIRSTGKQQTSRFHPEPRGTLELPKALGEFALSLDGKTAAIVHENEIFVLHPAESAGHFSLKVGTYYQSVALSPDGRYLAANPIGGKPIEIWDLGARAPAPDPPVLDGGRYFMFSPDGKWFVTSSARGIRFWQVGTWQPGVEFTHPGSQPGPMAFSRDGRILAMAVSPSAIELIQFPSREPLARLENPDRRRLLTLTFSPDGRRLAAAGTEQLVLLWDIALISRELAELNLRGKLPMFPEISRDSQSAAIEPEIPPAEPGTE